MSFLLSIAQFLEHFIIYAKGITIFNESTRLDYLTNYLRSFPRFVRYPLSYYKISDVDVCSLKKKNNK